MKQTGRNTSNLLTIKPDNQVMPAKLALIDARSVRIKADIIVDCIVEHDFDIICFTETWLSGNNAATIAAIFFFFSMDIISPDLDSFRAAAVGVGV